MIKMFVSYNPNPQGRNVGDCVIRAISKLLNQSWDEVYAQIAVYGLMHSDMPTANHVWASFLLRNGYKRRLVSDDCPECYTVEDFCRDHPHGSYLLAIDGHVVTVIDGCIYDSWDSSHEIPIFYWYKDKEEEN
jgi:hypothetical protein